MARDMADGWGLQRKHVSERFRMKSFTSIVITGASSGIGEALALDYAVPGAALALYRPRRPAPRGGGRGPPFGPRAPP